MQSTVLKPISQVRVAISAGFLCTRCCLVDYTTSRRQGVANQLMCIAEAKLQRQRFKRNRMDKVRVVTSAFKSTL